MGEGPQLRLPLPDGLARGHQLPPRQPDVPVEKIESSLLTQRHRHKGPPDDVVKITRNARPLLVHAEPGQLLLGDLELDEGAGKQGESQQDDADDGVETDQHGLSRNRVGPNAQQHDLDEDCGPDRRHAAVVGRREKQKGDHHDSVEEDRRDEPLSGQDRDDEQH